MIAHVGSVPVEESLPALVGTLLLARGWLAVHLRRGEGDPDVIVGKDTLRIERTYQAPVEKVFDAWTSEEVIRRWWQAERNWETPEAEVDLRVGGVVHVTMRDPEKDENYGGGGTYTEVDRPNRLAFTWLWDGETNRSLIEIDFEEKAGATTVTFTHSGLWDEETVRSHDYGWSNILDSLGREL